MPQTAFTVACGLSLVLLALPAPWHIKARNAGTILYIAWSFVGNLVYLVNSIVWSGKFYNPAPIWCDIATKIIIGLNVALPCVSLCIQRRLHQISRISQVQTTYDQRRRQIYIDVAIGLGAPLLIMALHYIVQGHRFDIIEDYGCWPNVYSSWPAFVVLLPWPTIFSTISLIYAVLTFRNFLRRRSTFNELLKSQNTGLSVNKYIRLMALASLEMLFVFPMSVVVLAHNASTRINPWISWENTHYNFSRVGYISLFLFRLNQKNYILFQLTRWCVPLSGILFFLFFGMASEARKQYKQVWNAIMRRLGVTSPSLTFTDKKDAPTTSASSRTKRPSYVKRNTTSTMPMTSPTDKKRPDTFAWLEEGLPFDELDYKMPTSPDTVYSPTNGNGGRPGHTPCTPSTSTSTSHLWDTTSTIGRHASISTARTGKTTRFSQDDDATICGVPTSLKRSDSMDKPLPGIPFENFAYFRQSQISNRDRDRQSAAVSIHSVSSGSASISRKSARSLSLSQLMLPTLTQEQEQGYADADTSFVLGAHGVHADDDGDQVQIDARHSAAPSSELDLDLETQVQIFVSSPTSTTFTSSRATGDDDDDEREEMPNVPNDIERAMTPVIVGEEGGRATPTPSVRFVEPIPRTRTAAAAILPLAAPSDPVAVGGSRLAPPIGATTMTPNSESRPLSVVSQDGGETVFFTPLPGRLSLAPADFEMTPSGLRLVYVDEEGHRVSMYDHDAADLQTPRAQ